MFLLKKQPIPYRLIITSSISALFGSFLLAYSVIALDGVALLLGILIGCLCLGMSFSAMYIIWSISRASQPIPGIVYTTFPKGDALTFESASEVLRPYMNAYFAELERRKNNPRELKPGPLSALVWPCWFIQIVEQGDRHNLDLLLGAEKALIDFIADRLFTIGLEDTVRSLQSYRASAPETNEQALEVFQTQLPQMKEAFLAYIREHYNKPKNEQE